MIKTASQPSRGTAELIDCTKLRSKEVKKRNETEKKKRTKSN